MELTNEQKMMIGGGIVVLCILLLLFKKQADNRKAIHRLEMDYYTQDVAEVPSQAAQPKTDGLSPEQIAKIAAQAATETVAKMAKAHDERKSEAAQTTEKVATDAPAEAVKG